MGPLSAEGIADMVDHNIGARGQSASLAWCDLAILFSRLEGVPLRRDDLLALSAVGAAKRHVDDVYDLGSIQSAVEKGSLLARAVLGSNSALERIADPSITKAIYMVCDNLKPEALRHLGEIMLAQVDSIGQRDPNISDSAIEGITRRKAASILLATQVNPSMNAERVHCHRELAYLFQLMDDFSDRFTDRASGIHTLVTRSSSHLEAELLLFRQYRRVRALFVEQYGARGLLEIFSYIDTRMRGLGIL